jgi:hypothetical protein
MGIFIQKVMFHRPGVIDAQLVSQHDLFQRIHEEAMLVTLFPGFW